ncbi:transcription factor S [Candidatus Woesearchaeota archaeon]|nr:transcription factor S [Candidatus Woesearchaeota archaeon]
MLFCKKCGGIMMPKKDNGKTFLVCPKCGYKTGAKGAVISEKCKSKDDCIEVVEKIETRPLVDEECPKCKHKKARSWEKQMRAADEPPTRFYECEKCKHIWREQS